MCAFVSSGQHNQWPQTGWLKTIGICSLKVLEARSLRTKCYQGHVHSESSGKRIPLPICPPSSALLDLKLHHCNFCLFSHSHLSSECVLLSLFFYFIRTLVIGVGYPLILHDIILPTSAKSLFPQKGIFLLSPYLYCSTFDTWNYNIFKV